MHRKSIRRLGFVLSAVVLLALPSARASATCTPLTEPTDGDFHIRATFNCANPGNNTSQYLHLTWGRGVTGATFYRASYYDPPTNTWKKLKDTSPETASGFIDIEYDSPEGAYLKTHQGENVQIRLQAHGGTDPDCFISSPISILRIWPVAAAPQYVIPTNQGNRVVRIFWWVNIPNNSLAHVYRDNDPNPIASVPYGNVSYDYTETSCGEHVYKVVAETSDGCRSAATESMPFDESAYSPPIAPVIEYPLNGKTQCLPTDNLRWAVSCGAYAYEVQVATNSSFTNLVLNESFVEDVTVQTPALSPSTTYYWRVRALNDLGQSSWTTAQYTTGRTPWWPSTTDDIHAVRRIYKSYGGGVVSTGYVYWFEHATLHLYPEPMDCPCNFSWGTITGGGPDDYRSETQGNLWTVHNDGVNTTRSLLRPLTPSNAWGTGEIRNWGFSLFSGFRQGPPDGGCPYVGVWTHGGYADENNILVASESPENRGVDVTDWYALENEPVLRDGRYWVRLHEFEHERSQIDQMRVFALDHPAGTEVQVDRAGGVTVFELIRELDLGNLRDQPRQPGDIVPLGAPGIPAGDPPSGYRLRVRGVSPLKGEETGSIRAREEALGTFAFRERPTTALLPLRSEDLAELTFDHPATVSKAELVRIVPGEWKLAALASTRSRHSVSAAPLPAALEVDQEYFSLSPGEEAEFGVDAAPLAAGLVRKLVVSVTGRYEKIPQPDALEDGPATSVPTLRVRSTDGDMVVFAFSAGLARRARLSIFDVQGRELAQVADVENPSGVIERTWNASKASPGIYFARLSDGSGRVLANSRFAHTR